MSEKNLLDLLFGTTKEEIDKSFNNALILLVVSIPSVFAVLLIMTLISKWIGI